MTALQTFEASLAKVADSALVNIAPSGGFADFLTKNPAVAALFVVAVTSAHTYLSGLESKLEAPAV